MSHYGLGETRTRKLTGQRCREKRPAGKEGKQKRPGITKALIKNLIGYFKSKARNFLNNEFCVSKINIDSGRSICQVAIFRLTLGRTMC